jgi:hypothetical protein
MAALWRIIFGQKNADQLSLIGMGACALLAFAKAV